MAEISEKDQKILWARAAGMCSICRTLLTLDKTTGAAATLGAMCHIIGEKDGAARYRSDLPEKERNSYSNLILLCSHHHDIIDRDDEHYSVDDLHKMKSDHEEWVRETLSNTRSGPDEQVGGDFINVFPTISNLTLHQNPYFSGREKVLV